MYFGNITVIFVKKSVDLKKFTILNTSVCLDMT